MKRWLFDTSALLALWSGWQAVARFQELLIDLRYSEKRHCLRQSIGKRALCCLKSQQL